MAMACKRCHEERPLTHMVTSDIMCLRVCHECAVAAAELVDVLELRGPGQIYVVPIGELRVEALA